MREGRRRLVGAAGRRVGRVAGGDRRLSRATRRADARAARRLRRAEDQRGTGAARDPQHATIVRRASSRPAASSIRSIVILREYARRGRIELRFVEARARRTVRQPPTLLAAIGATSISSSSRRCCSTPARCCRSLPALVGAAHAGGARVLLDVYHSLGVLPVDIAALDADFASAAATSICAAARAPASCICIRGISTAASARSTSAGSPRRRRSTTCVPIRREFAAGGDALAGIDAAGADLLPGARRPAVHGGGRRRAAARLFAGAAAHAGRCAGRARRARRKAAPTIAAPSSSCAASRRARGPVSSSAAA